MNDAFRYGGRFSVCGRRLRREIFPEGGYSSFFISLMMRFMRCSFAEGTFGLSGAASFVQRRDFSSVNLQPLRSDDDSLSHAQRKVMELSDHVAGYIQ